MEVYQAVRLRALQEEPEAFGSSYEEWLSRPLSSVVQRLRDTGNKFTLGAFIDNTLVGIITFQREEGAKDRHKGTITGMYIVPEARSKGVGKLLLRETIARARALPALEKINLTVVTVNTPARKLYLSVGFEVYGLEKRSLKLEDRYLDEELMALQLQDSRQIRVATSGTE